VTSVQAGDHVVMSFIPSCGRCGPCSSGRQNLCDLGQYLMLGTPIANGVHRMRAKGQGLAPMSLVGCFATHQVVHEASVIKIDSEVPLDKAALVSCGVATGFGSAVHTARVTPGTSSSWSASVGSVRMPCKGPRWPVRAGSWLSTRSR